MGKIKFKKISKRNRDIAMKAICQYDLGRKPGHEIAAEYLYYHGLPKTVDAVQVCETLAAMGLIEYTSDKKDDCKFISITDSGKCYFQVEEEKKREFRHDWRIAVFSAVFGALLSEPLWAVLRWLVKYLLG